MSYRYYVQSIDDYVDFSIANIDGSEASFSLLDGWKYDIFFDKPGQFIGTAIAGHSISNDATIDIQFKGKVCFRGYIDQPEVQADRTAKLTAQEQQRLLQYRILQIYEYPAGTDIEVILSSDEPDDGYAGLLYLANSLIPQGAFVPYLITGGYHIYQIANAGTASRFGTMTKLYEEDTLLTQEDSLMDLGAGEWYQSATTLYVWCSDNKDPKYHLVSVPNFKDTLLRLGTLRFAPYTFTGPIRLAKETADAALKRIMSSSGAEFQWEHRRNGYSYLMSGNDSDTKKIGRGSATAPVAFYEDA